MTPTRGDWDYLQYGSQYQEYDSRGDVRWQGAWYIHTRNRGWWLLYLRATWGTYAIWHQWAREDVAYFHALNSGVGWSLVLRSTTQNGYAAPSHIKKQPKRIMATTVPLPQRYLVAQPHSPVKSYIWYRNLMRATPSAINSIPRRIFIRFDFYRIIVQYTKCTNSKIFYRVLSINQILWTLNYMHISAMLSMIWLM